MAFIWEFYVSLQDEELISASESGDVMTVVSLLNSGADVQTEDDVCIMDFHIVNHTTKHLSVP